MLRWQSNKEPIQLDLIVDCLYCYLREKELLSGLTILQKEKRMLANRPTQTQAHSHLSDMLSNGPISIPCTLISSCPPPGHGQHSGCCLHSI